MVGAGQASLGGPTRTQSQVPRFRQSEGRRAVPRPRRLRPPGAGVVVPSLAFPRRLTRRDARVMWDHATGRSKGYGFVSFRTREDAQAAIEKMQGQYVGSRRVRCGWAQHKQVRVAASPAGAGNYGGEAGGSSMGAWVVWALVGLATGLPAAPRPMQSAARRVRPRTWQRCGGGRMQLAGTQLIRGATCQCVEAQALGRLWALGRPAAGSCRLSVPPPPAAHRHACRCPRCPASAMYVVAACAFAGRVAAAAQLPGSGQVRRAEGLGLAAQGNGGQWAGWPTCRPPGVVATGAGGSLQPDSARICPGSSGDGSWRGFVKEAGWSICKGIAAGSGHGTLLDVTGRSSCCRGRVCCRRLLGPHTRGAGAGVTV